MKHHFIACLVVVTCAFNAFANSCFSFYNECGSLPFGYEDFVGVCKHKYCGTDQTCQILPFPSQWPKRVIIATRDKSYKVVNGVTTYYVAEPSYASPGTCCNCTQPGSEFSDE